MKIKKTGRYQIHREDGNPSNTLHFAKKKKYFLALLTAFVTTKVRSTGNVQETHQDEREHLIGVHTITTVAV